MQGVVLFWQKERKILPSEVGYHLRNVTGFVLYHNSFNHKQQTTLWQSGLIQSLICIYCGDVILQSAGFSLCDVVVTWLSCPYCGYKQIRLKEECFHSSSVPMNVVIRRTSLAHWCHGKLCIHYALPH